MRGWLRDGLHATTIATLTALLDHMNPQGECWPSIQTIAELIGCKRRTAQRHIQNAYEAGWIDCLERPGNSTLYRATTPDTSDTPVMSDTPDTHDTRDTDDTGGVSPVTQEGCHPCHGRGVTDDTQTEKRTDHRTEKEQTNASAASAQAQVEAHEESVELHALLKTYGHKIPMPAAEALAAEIAKFHESPLAYVESRQDNDGLLQRANSSVWLLKTLKDDAARDGIRQDWRHKNDQPDAEPKQADDYKHPAAWLEALAILEQALPSFDFLGFVAPLRADVEGDRVKVYSDDDAAELAKENYAQQITEAAEKAGITHVEFTGGAA